MHRRFGSSASFPSSFEDGQLTYLSADPTDISFGSGFTASGIIPTTSRESSSLSQKSHDPVASASISITDLVTKILITHPCTVLRRQCQVHQFAKSLHLTPFTLIPVVYKIVSSEGLSTLWKGAVGSGVLWGLFTAGEILIADIFGLPRSTAVIVTPFIVSAFIETVRSESGLCCELRMMDVVTNGINRLRFDFFGPRDNSKRFSLFHLLLPTTCLYTSHYLITISIYDWIHVLAKRYVSRKPSCEKTVFDQYFPQIFATLTSQMLADFALYPFETVIHRLYIQGTRTLIDNLDNGVTAISITGKYVGFFDCFRTILNREGFWPLYAGVGALGLQYVLHLCLLRFIRSVVKYGNRAVSVQQQESNLVNTAHTPLQFDSAFFSSATNESSAPLADTIFNSRYPAFGQTVGTFGRTSPPLFTSASNIFVNRPSGLYPGTNNN
uniref:Solute carrier family 25 member 46 n=1 Tax=Setaria digitata TaxID=48799 RepID=A0A915Q017_9BILA